MTTLQGTSLVQRVVALSMAMLLVACAAKDPAAPPADPAGTITSELRVQGQGAFAIDFDVGTVSASVTTFAYDLLLDANTNFVVGQTSFGVSTRRIADVGAVGGLGAVTAVPSAGFVTTLRASVGHGYVVQDNAKNWRLFVESLTTSASTGGVIGVTIKWTSL